MNIETRLRKLEEGTPGAYRTFDANGKPAVESDLPAPDWFRASLALLRSRGREAEKEELRRQLRRSVGPDSYKGRLYEVIGAMAEGPVKRGDR